MLHVFFTLLLAVMVGTAHTGIIVLPNEGSKSMLTALRQYVLYQDFLTWKFSSVRAPDSSGNPTMVVVPAWRTTLISGIVIMHYPETSLTSIHFPGDSVVVDIYRLRARPVIYFLPLKRDFVFEEALIFERYRQGNGQVNVSVGLSEGKVSLDMSTPDNERTTSLPALPLIEFVMSQSFLLPYWDMQQRVQEDVDVARLRR